MLKKLIDKLFSEKITEEKIECAIDDKTVDCETFDDDQEKAFTGVPAPVEHVLDEWFMSPYGEPLPPKKSLLVTIRYPLYAPYTAVDEFKRTVCMVMTVCIRRCMILQHKMVKPLCN